jgi:DNA-binding MarR family transcriptional regulator
MQLLPNATESRGESVSLAALVLETVPRVMHFVRSEMRSQRAESLSVPQFRALGFLARRGGASLSDLAEHLGLALPAASRLIDGLVTRGLVIRAPSTADRRRVTLTLSACGESMLDAARAHTVEHIAAKLATLPAAERAALGESLEALRRLFGSGPAAPPAMPADNPPGSQLNR